MTTWRPCYWSGPPAVRHPGRPAETAAALACASTWAHSLAGCAVDGDPHGIVDPETLARIGWQLIVSGQYLAQ